LVAALPSWRNAALAAQQLSPRALALLDSAKTVALRSHKQGFWQDDGARAA